MRESRTCWHNITFQCMSLLDSYSSEALYNHRVNNNVREVYGVGRRLDIPACIKCINCTLYVLNPADVDSGAEGL